MVVAFPSKVQIHKFVECTSLRKVKSTRETQQSRITLSHPVLSWEEVGDLINDAENTFAEFEVEVLAELR